MQYFNPLPYAFSPTFTELTKATSQGLNPLTRASRNPVNALPSVFLNSIISLKCTCATKVQQFCLLGESSEIIEVASL